MKRFLTLILLIFTFSLAVSAEKAVTFSDLPESHWAYLTVMPMVEKGLFNGTSTVVDGVGTFSPDKAMTRGEFLAVICRYYFSDEIYTPAAGLPWWDPYFTIAIKYDLVSVRNDFLDCNEIINRAEAVSIIDKLMTVQGTPLENVSYDTIPDSEKILRYGTLSDIQYDNETLLSAVRRCIGEGIIGGVDTKGTFAPYGSLTRAAAATIICRVTEPEKRLPKKLDSKHPLCASDGHYFTMASDGFALVKPATEMEEGLSVLICTRCGATKDVIFRAHKHSAGTLIDRIKCGDNVWEEYKCRVNQTVPMYDSTGEVLYTSSYITCNYPMPANYWRNVNSREEATHTYTEWQIVAYPDKGVEGRMEKVCTKCGDTYVKIIPMYSSDDAKLDIRKSYGYGHVTGYLDHRDEYHKSKLPPTPVGEFTQYTNVDAVRSLLNGYVGVIYSERFFGGGIAMNSGDYNKGVGTIIKHPEDNRAGVNVFGWRKSLDNTANDRLNMMMEAILYLTGDREVAYALWHVIDFMSINGSDKTTAEKIESFGFKTSNETSTSIELTMKNTHIFWEWGEGIKGNNFYFSKK